MVDLEDITSQMQTTTMKDQNEGNFIFLLTFLCMCKNFIQQTDQMK
jgi:hypothetical protein